MALGTKGNHFPKSYSYYPNNRYYFGKCDAEPLTPNFYSSPCKCLCGKHSNAFNRNKYNMENEETDSVGLGGNISPLNSAYYQKRLLGAGTGLKNIGNSGLSTSINNIGYISPMSERMNTANPCFMKNKSLPNCLTHDNYKRMDQPGNYFKLNQAKKRTKDEQLCEHCYANSGSYQDDMPTCKPSWYAGKNQSLCRDHVPYSRPQPTWEARPYECCTHTPQDNYSPDDLYLPSTRSNYYKPCENMYKENICGGSPHVSDPERVCGNVYCQNCSDLAQDNCDNFRCVRNKPRTSGIFYGGCGNMNHFPSYAEERKNFPFGRYSHRSTPNYYDQYSYARGHLGREESGKNMSWSKNWYDEEDTEGTIEVWNSANKSEKKTNELNTDLNSCAWKSTVPIKNKLRSVNSDVLIKSVENLIKSSNFAEKKPTPVQSSVEFPFNKTVPRINCCNLSSFTEDVTPPKPTYLQPEKCKSKSSAKSYRKKENSSSL